MDFSCLQNIVDKEEVDKNGKFETDEVTTSVPADDPPNEFYNSTTESDKYGYSGKELNNNRNEALQLGNEPLKTVRNVENVELCTTNEEMEAGLDLHLINEAADKLVDLAMSEVCCDETNVHKLSAITKFSPRKDVGVVHEDPRTPEVTELRHEKQVVSQTEQECVHDSEILNSTVDQGMKLEELTQTMKKKRRKSASNSGSVSQSVPRPLTTRPSCDRLQKVRDAVERAIRVSITKILYSFFPTRNFNLPFNFNRYFGASGR